MEDRWSRQVPIEKVDEDERLVFGWLSVTKNADGTPVEDGEGDMIDPAELEKAQYAFVLNSRVGGEMHETLDVSKLVESVVFTPEKLAKMGIPATTTFESGGKSYLLEGAAWTGWHVTDDKVWKAVKGGKYKSFSIGGRAKRVAA